jgi:beta-xylosidase
VPPAKDSRRLSKEVIVALIGAAATIVASIIAGLFTLRPWSPQPPPTPTVPPTSTLSCFSDEFTQASYDTRWQWIAGGNSTVTTDQGALSISAPIDQDLYNGNTSAPKLLQSIEGNFTMETLVDFMPSHTYQGAGLLLWQDRKNFIRLEYGYGDFGAIIFEQEVNGTHHKIVGPFSKDAPNIPTAVKQVELRIQRNKTTVSAWWQDPSRGSGWQAVGSTQTSFPTSIMGGLVVVNKPQAPNPDTTGAPIIAHFDYFRVNCERAA